MKTYKVTIVYARTEQKYEVRAKDIGSAMRDALELSKECNFTESVENNVQIAIVESK